MARRTAAVVIERDGRDRGGVFVLQEMAAIPATDWFIRAMQILARSGADVPADIFAQGAAGFVTMGIGAVVTGLGKAPWFEVKPLLDELLTCVQSYQPPGGTVALTNWNIIAGQIEEPATVLQLHEEVISLHLGFSLAAKISNFRTLIEATVASLTPNIETSTGEPESSSERISQA